MPADQLFDAPAHSFGEHQQCEQRQRDQDQEGLEMKGGAAAEEGDPLGQQAHDDEVDPRQEQSQ